MSYLTTPYIGSRTSAETSTLNGLFTAAAQGTRGRAVRFAHLGDSRATALGFGNNHMSMLNYEWWLRYGNCPETALLDGADIGGGGGHVTPGDGVWGPASQTHNEIPTVRSTSHQLQGLEGVPSGLAKLITIWVDQGALWNFNHDAYQALIPTAQVPRTNEYISRLYNGVGFSAEVYIPRLPGNHTSLAYQWIQSNVSTQDFFGGGTFNVRAQSTVDITTAVGVEGPVLTFAIPAITWDPAPSPANLHSVYGELHLGSAHATTRVDVMGVVCKSANAKGIAVSFFGAGGLMAGTYLTGRELCYVSLNAYAPDAIVIHLGVNDAGNLITAAQYKIDMQAIITWIKANCTNYTGGTPLIILDSDPDQELVGTPGARAIFDLYADKLYELALANSGVIFVNSRRALDEQLGWREGVSMTTYLADNVHPNALGCAHWARVRANLLNIVPSTGVGIGGGGGGGSSTLSRRSRRRGR